ncbi:MAG: hypothetical protein K6T86_04570 [Pirellulales bacterium]|nr:hypothetical protein [Pirellulales bacterium]
MTRVFTVYNCGTGFNRDQTQELIAHLATRTRGWEEVHWMITDGVGKIPAKGSVQAHLPGDKKFVPRFVTAGLGVAFGYGWNENVDRAMTVIKGLLQQPAPPSTINMAGWSRGAVTCHMLAHALHEDNQTSHLQVNIFAVDPVPGPFNHGRVQKEIPPNVLRYTAIFMEDEARWIMKPAAVRAAPQNTTTRFKFLTMPGQHNTGVYTTNEAGQIIAALAYKFLTKHGTDLRDPIMRTDRGFCELYAAVRLKLRAFRRQTGPALQKLGGLAAHHRVQRLAYKLNIDIQQSSYFINEHHMDCFKRAFPDLYRLLKKPVRDDDYHAQQLNELLQNMQRMAPQSFMALRHVGIID